MVGLKIKISPNKKEVNRRQITFHVVDENAPIT